MKVILTEKIPALGNIGEVVTVSQGYARNFLVPQKKAVVVNENALGQLEGHRRALGKKIEEEKKTALEIKEKLEGITLEFVKRVGANGNLFGSVTTGELAKELLNRGIEIERRVLSLEKPIKQLGTFKAKVKLFSEVEVVFNVKVEIDPAQADEIKKRHELANAKKKLKAKKQKVVEVETEEETPVVPITLTEEQRLKEEADRILGN